MFKLPQSTNDHPSQLTHQATTFMILVRKEAIKMPVLSATLRSISEWYQRTVQVLGHSMK